MNKRETKLKFKDNFNDDHKDGKRLSHVISKINVLGSTHLKYVDHAAYKVWRDRIVNFLIQYLKSNNPGVESTLTQAVLNVLNVLNGCLREAIGRNK